MSLDFSLPIAYTKMNPSAQEPRRMHAWDAGHDLYSYYPLVLPPRSIIKAGTGIAVAIPYGYVGFICPRSGLAIEGIGIANSPGSIDSGYRGEVCVLLENKTKTQHRIEPGVRIAQLVVVAVRTSVVWEETGRLPPSDGRETGGFGSTGES